MLKFTPSGQFEKSKFYDVSFHNEKIGEIILNGDGPAFNQSKSTFNWIPLDWWCEIHLFMKKTYLVRDLT